MGQDYKVIFDDAECVIKDKKRNKDIVAKGKMTKDWLLKLILTLSDIYALKTIAKVDSELWHRRFGHLNYNGLALMKRMNMVNGLPHIEVDKNLCEGCLLGKQHRESFLDFSHQTSGPLQLVNTNIYSPMNIPLLVGARYSITFIDDFIRKTWVFLLKFKSDVF